MTLLFAAGDPGGSRALLPVITACAQAQIDFRVVNNGFLAQELPAKYAHQRIEATSDIFANYHVRGYIWGSSVSDVLPLSLARKARQQHIPIVHILDNWSSYRDRLCTDRLPPLFPDVYIVMDFVAQQAAIQEGIPPTSIHICGHPAFAQLKNTHARLGQISKKNILTRAGIAPRTIQEKTVLAFINEPFRRALGQNTQAIGHCGFTEQEVLLRLLETLHSYEKELFLCIMPHPKDNPLEVLQFWQNTQSSLQGAVLPAGQSSEFLPAFDGVIGMASLVLYEAWMLSLPVLALQPNCRMESMKHFAHRKNVIYTHKYSEFNTACNIFLPMCKTSKISLTDVLNLHSSAPMAIRKILQRVCNIKIMEGVSDE